MDKQLKGQRETKYAQQCPLPINMLVEVTNACNHKCIFCAHSKMKRKIGMMDLNLYKSIAKQAYDGGTREIGFYMTGEPLMNNRLKEYVSYAKLLGFEYIYMTTNGVHADIETMKELIKAGLNSVKFSINAGTAETYKTIHGRADFERVLSNLIHLSEYIRAENLDIGLFVTCIACQQNEAEIELLRSKVKDYVNDFTAPQVYNQGGNMYEIRDTIMLDPDYKLMKTPCSMVFNRLHITWEGYLSACCVDFDNNLVVADLNKVSLLEAWNCEKMIELRRMHLNDSIPTNVVCYNCVHNANNKIEPIGLD